jgi:hypothetical protein
MRALSFVIEITVTLNFLAFELGVVQLGIEAFLGEQLLVLALFDDIAVLHDQDPVRFEDGAELIWMIKRNKILGVISG